MLCVKQLEVGYCIFEADEKAYRMAEMNGGFGPEFGSAPALAPAPAFAKN